MHYYDRTGKKISIDEYVALTKQKDYKRYKRVREDTVGSKWVSTVWLGRDHGIGRHGPPIIFETMVFNVGSNPEGVFQQRYTTEAKAIAGHEQVVLRLKGELILRNYAEGKINGTG